MYNLGYFLTHVWRVITCVLIVFLHQYNDSYYRSENVCIDTNSVFLHFSSI
jgi:hypothetical protein